MELADSPAPPPAWEAELDLGEGGGFAAAPSAAVLNLGGDCRIWLYTPPCDMRRSFDGLSALVRDELGRDPANGQWHVFVNRRRTMPEVLALEQHVRWRTQRGFGHVRAAAKAVTGSLASN